MTSNSSDTVSPPVNEIADQVKYAILLVYGIDNPSPDTLSDNALLSNFYFNDYQWMELASGLTKIIRKYNPNQSVTAPDLENLVTVLDCINLITQKSKS